MKLPNGSGEADRCYSASQIVAYRHGRPNSARQPRGDAGENWAARVYRLDARSCLRRDVSGALLQLLAEPGRKNLEALSVVPGRSDVTSALIYFSCGNFVCHGDTALARKRHAAKCDRENNDSARCR